MKYLHGVDSISEDHQTQATSLSSRIKIIDDFHPETVPRERSNEDNHLFCSSFVEGNEVFIPVYFSSHWQQRMQQAAAARVIWRNNESQSCIMISSSCSDSSMRISRTYLCAIFITSK
jgi:hypothetical protein